MIIEQTLLQHTVIDKLSVIANILKSNKSQKNIGFLSGDIGEAFFLFHYDRTFNSPSAYNRGIELIENVFEAINNGHLYHTYCTGLAGIGWAIEYLTDNNFIDADIKESLNEIDDLVGAMMINDMENGNYDYLHGASGSVLYLLKRRKSNPIKIDNYIKNYLELLEETAVEDNNALKWSSIIDSKTKRIGYNISLSHGSTSIISVLSKIYSNGIEPEFTMKLAEKSVSYLFNQRIDSYQSISYFPTYSIESDSNITYSRLSWCYGDLGISAALWQSGKNFNKKNWMNFAEKIALKSIGRKKDNTGIADAGLCHGTSGLSHMYKRFFINTENRDFLDASEFWLKETINMAKFQDGLAGYKSYNPSETGGWVNETNFLNGISGIGMSMLSSISNIDISWDESLLLS